MARAKKVRAEGVERGAAGSTGVAGDLAAQAPRCLAIAERGIRTSVDFAAFSSALMYDVVSDRMAPNKANAAYKGGALLLKVKEMEFRWGGERKNHAGRMLSLAPAVG